MAGRSICCDICIVMLQQSRRLLEVSRYSHSLEAYLRCSLAIVSEIHNIQAKDNDMMKNGY